MGKTGGGRGTNQHGIKGVSQAKVRQSELMPANADDLMESMENRQPQRPYGIVKVLTTSDGRIIELRDDELKDDDIVLIHMGAGKELDVVRSILANYDTYRGLEGEQGMFCISVYGVVHGVTREAIFAAMDHTKFGEARYGEIKNLVRVNPTSIYHIGAQVPSDDIQSSHYDLVLVPPVSPQLDARRISELSDEELADVRAYLGSLWGPLSDKFNPRTAKEKNNGSSDS